MITLSIRVDTSEVHKFIKVTVRARGTVLGPHGTHSWTPVILPTGTTHTDPSAGISRDDQPLPTHPDNLHRLSGSLTSAHSGTYASPTGIQPPAMQPCLLPPCPKAKLLRFHSGTLPLGIKHSATWFILFKKKKKREKVYFYFTNVLSKQKCELLLQLLG
jgi:hypothetical protein